MNKKTATKAVGIIFAVAGAILFVAMNASAFTGPSQAPGSGSGLLTASGTNIGIGPAIPSATLQLSGTGSDPTLGIEITNTDGANIFFRKAAGFTNQPEIGAATNNDFVLYTNNLARITIKNDGKVGIATTTPAEILSVVGNILTSGSFIGSLSGNLSAANVTGPSAFGSGYGTYNYAFPGALAVGTTTVTGLQSNSLFVNGNVGIGTSTPIGLLHLANGATTILYASSTNGRVGINTTAPTKLLDVQTSEGTDSIGASLSGGAAGMYLSSNSLTLTRGNTSTFGMTIQTKVSSGGFGTNGGYIAFSPSSTEAMRILVGGNVGIGTSTPSSPLVVDGGSGAIPILSISRDTPGQANTWITKISSTFTGATGTLFIGPSVVTADISLTGVSNSVTPQFTLQGSTGNVGIATTTPTNAKLVINGAYYSPIVVKGNCTGAVTIDWSAGNTQHCILTGNVTFTFTNGQSGGSYKVVLKQDGAGSHTVTWPGTVRWGSLGTPSLTVTPLKTDYVGFIYNGVDSTYDGVAFNANY